jgi:hypothetical protein
MKRWIEVSPYNGLEEDAPTTSAGTGHVHGIGVGPYGEPGVDPKKKKKDQVLVDREGKIDGRTKAYREHRKKLEQARQKREDVKKGKNSKFIETIKKRTAEMTSQVYAAGLDSVNPMASLNTPTPKKKKKK